MYVHVKIVGRRSVRKDVVVGHFSVIVSAVLIACPGIFKRNSSIVLHYTIYLFYYFKPRKMKVGDP